MLIEKIWYQNHPVKYLLWPLLWPLSRLFYWLSSRRKRDYLLGKKKSYQPPVPVIVVGNITAGGNGKTPVVIWLVEQLRLRGYTPGVVSRGYGGKAKQYPLTVTEETLASDSGDEPLLIAARTKAAVVVSPVRTEAVKCLIKKEIDVIISDDGMQHYALGRSVELCVLDGQRRYGSAELIPLGPLREPLSRLSCVDFVINNGGVAESDEIAMQLVPSLAVNLLTGETTQVSALKQLVAFAGIGHPERFYQTLKGLKADLIATKNFVDHKAFKADELRRFTAKGQSVIMTEKDAVKCRHFAEPNWWFLPVEAQFSAFDAEKILAHIEKVIANNGSSIT